MAPGPRQWFRETIDKELRDARFGDESFAETLEALLGEQPGDQVPGRVHCAQRQISRDWSLTRCRNARPAGMPILLTDGLRIHEQFEEQ